MENVISKPWEAPPGGDLIEKKRVRSARFVYKGLGFNKITAWEGASHGFETPASGSEVSALLRIPTETLHRDCTRAVELDSLGLEECSLQSSRSAAQTEIPAGANDPLPGDATVGAQSAHSPAHASGTPGLPQQPGYLAIAHHTSGRNLPNQFVDLLEEIICVRQAPVILLQSTPTLELRLSSSTTSLQRPLIRPIPARVPTTRKPRF